MAILPIYTYDQSVLRKKAKPILSEIAAGDGLRRLVGDMFDTMRNANGIGLAANQVGSLQRVIVIDVSEMEDMKGHPPLVILNPLVVAGEGTVEMEEGCLSIPDIREQVERPERIRVRFRDLEYAVQEIDAEGILSRVLQHEVDHLNGVLFIDRISAEKKKLLRGRLNKIHQGEIEVTYPVVDGSTVGLRRKVAVK